MTPPLNTNQNQENLSIFFQQYAVQILRKQNQDVIESLRRRRISTDKFNNLEETYKISVQLDSTLDFKQIKNSIQQQIDACADFIKNFHIGILGQRHTWFDIYEIEIIINKKNKSFIEFDSGKLVIHPSYRRLRYLNRCLSYQEIKKLWNRGEHLDKISPIYRNWWLFNPIGVIRSNLRAMLLLAVNNQLLGIDKLLSELGHSQASVHNSLSLKEETRNETGDTQSFSGSKISSPVRQATLALLKETINEDKLGINLEQVLKDQDEETLIQLITLYQKNLADPKQIEEIINAGLLVLKEMIQKEQSDVNIKMFGFVNVGNYHRIDVALNLSSGYLKNYIDVIPRKVAIKAILLGFVNVYTIDDITVKPNFHGVMNLNFETVALERSLRELQLLV